jgi:hypothetical protein
MPAARVFSWRFAVWADRGLPQWLNRKEYRLMPEGAVPVRLVV